MLKNTFKENVLSFSKDKMPAEGFIVTKVTPLLITLTITGLTSLTTTTITVRKKK